MNTAGHSLIDDLNKLIDEHLDQPDYSIENLCRQVGVSRSTLTRVVKEQTGLSVALYIRQCRLKSARALLATTELRVSEIADRVGFGTSQELSRYFTEMVGASPSEYRKQVVLATPTPYPVLPAGQEPTGAVATTPADSERPVNRVAPVGRRWWWVGAVVGLLLMGGVWWVFRSQRSAPSAAQPVTLAVLPFRNLGPAQSQYYAEGVMEQIHGLLTYVDDMHVIARTSASRYASTDKPLDQIARELGVTYLLTGQVRQQENRVTVSVELVLAGENRSLWSNTYEGHPKDVFGFMSQTARQVADELNRKLSRTSQRHLDQAPTQNAEAYNEYLKGRYLLRNRTEAGIRSSIANFDRAIALDSGFADAWANRAFAYCVYGTEQYATTAEVWKQAEKDVLIAIGLDRENGMAYAILASLYELRNQWEQALITYPIALKFRPNDALINYWYSLALRSVGQLDAALQYNSKAVKLDPLDPIILAGYIGGLGMAGRFDKAKAPMAELERLHSRSYAYYWAKGLLYCNQQQFAKALTIFEAGYQNYPENPYLPTMMAYCCGRLGQTDCALARLDTLPDTPDLYPNRAIIYAGLGDADRCLTYLERGANAGRLPDYLKISPLFSFVRQTPRFKAVLRQVGLL